MSWPLQIAWWGPLANSGVIHYWYGYEDPPDEYGDPWYSLCGLARHRSLIVKLAKQPYWPYTSKGSTVFCKRCKYKKLVRDGR